MALETSLIGRVLGMFFGLFRVMSRRRNAGKWVGQWVAHDLVGRNLAQPMKGAGPAKVSLPGWWTFSSKLAFECYETDAHGQPTRHQIGRIDLDPDDPHRATRKGRYLDSAEVYEQRLTMLDDDTVLILPVPGRCVLGDDYRAHGWHRQR